MEINSDCDCVRTCKHVRVCIFEIIRKSQAWEIRQKGVNEMVNCAILHQFIRIFVQIWTRLMASRSSLRTSSLLSGCRSEHSRPSRTPPRASRWKQPPHPRLETRLRLFSAYPREISRQPTLSGSRPFSIWAFILNQRPYRSTHIGRWRQSRPLEAANHGLHCAQSASSQGWYGPCHQIVLNSSHFFSSYADEIPASGPPPALFPSAPEATIGSLCSSFKPLFGNLKRLTWHLISYEHVDLTTASSFIMCFREGKVSRPFYADLLRGSLEVAARAKRPFLQSVGPDEPASRSNKFSKYKVSFVDS